MVLTLVAPGPGYLPASEKEGATTLAKLPLADLMNVISQAKMPASDNGRNTDGIAQGKLPQTPAMGNRQRPGCRGVRSTCSTREPSARESSGSRPNSARPSSGGSRPNSCSRPNSARPNSARDAGPGSRPHSARDRPGSRPNSARGERGGVHPPGPSGFVRHIAHGKPFSPRVEFLEPKIVGNGSHWDEQRILMPERAYPCIATLKGAAEFHDRNAQRDNRPPWKPTIANRVSGMGVAVEAAFGMPPRPLSARPSSARRPHSARQVECPP